MDRQSKYSRISANQSCPCNKNKTNKKKEIYYLLKPQRYLLFVKSGYANGLDVTFSFPS